MLSQWFSSAALAIDEPSNVRGIKCPLDPLDVIDKESRMLSQYLSASGARH
jgi:hypothetical protein